MQKGVAQGTTVSLPVKETEIRNPTTPVAGVMPPSKQPQTTSVAAARIYPTLPHDDDDDEFSYFDTPSKPPPAKSKRVEEERQYEWEDSDEEITEYRRPYGKRPRFDLNPEYIMGEIELSPPQSPIAAAPIAVAPVRKPTLADPFTTPPRQILSTPHTPPDTRVGKSPAANLQPISLSLLHQLDSHKDSLGRNLYDRLSDHLIRCGRVADGAIKGRDAARAVNRKKDIRIEELERRVRILESEREVDRAVIGALKRNVDVLTGKVSRRDD